MAFEIRIRSWNIYIFVVLMTKNNVDTGFGDLSSIRSLGISQTTFYGMISLKILDLKTNHTSSDSINPRKHLYYKIKAETPLHVTAEYAVFTFSECTGNCEGTSVQCVSDGKFVNCSSTLCCWWQSSVKVIMLICGVQLCRINIIGNCRITK